MESLLTIFEFAFMQRAFIAGIAIGVIAPCIGLFTVVKRYSMLADAMAHISLVGASIGLLIGINPVVSAISTSVVAGIAIEKIRAGKQLLNESILAIFLSGSLAMAVLIFSSISQNFNILNYLFGSLTTISNLQVFSILFLTIIVLIIVKVFFNQFFLIVFDETLAKTQGINIDKYNTLLMIAVSITVGVAMQVMGVLSTGALMVIPPVAAMQAHTNFRNTLILSIILGVIAVVCGIYAAFYLDLPLGATIVVASIIELLMVIIFKRFA